jgi:hypothetical protein
MRQVLTIILAALASITLMSSCAHRADLSTHDRATFAEGLAMTRRATGPFDVTLTPQTDDQNVGDATIARMSLDKQFHGDLEAASKGQMLGVRTAVKGSAGYVAMERVVGTLNGRKGSFVLQHSSSMNRGEPQQSITVVPDSGTDQLVGLLGSMTIDIVDGKHFYNFEYRFDPTANP